MLDRLRRALRGDAPQAPTVAAEPTAVAQRVKVQSAILDPSAHTVNVVGESFHQDALERLGGGRHGGGVRRTDHIAGLLPEPTNPVDPDAVQVQIDGEPVGHLARADARAYRAVIDRLAANGLHTACHARLIGGWDHGGERGSIGVRLLIGTPEDCWREVDANLGAAPGPSPPMAPNPVPRVTRQPAVAARSVAFARDHEWVGKSVCFTGPSGFAVRGEPISRERQEGIAIGCGMVVLPRVTKALNILVVADATMHSGKTAMAAKYGTLVVDEATFWTTLGVALDRYGG